MSKSWKTTVSGVIAILGAISGGIVLLLDGRPETNPDYTAIAAAITAGFGLIFARDKNVTSEEQGLK